jgi:hypothetical protein
MHHSTNEVMILSFLHIRFLVIYGERVFLHGLLGRHFVSQSVREEIERNRTKSRRRKISSKFDLFFWVHLVHIGHVTISVLVHTQRV